MVPPWEKYPDIPLGSLAWRMGHGEEYWIAFSEWFARLDRDEQQRYAKDNPEPVGWEGFYRRQSASGA